MKGANFLSVSTDTLRQLELSHGRRFGPGLFEDNNLLPFMTRGPSCIELKKGFLGRSLLTLATLEQENSRSEKRVDSEGLSLGWSNFLFLDF